jgi:D-alanyl-D-alanine carboxypeptidase
MRSIILLLSLTCLCYANAQAQQARQMDDFIAPYVSSNNFYGTVYVAKAGKVIYKKSFGRAILESEVANDNNTKYHLASVSKPFTSTAILLLAQQGKLSIADPVSKYLPGLTRGDDITIHHLLCHTSGIQNINDFAEYDLLSMNSPSLDSIIKIFEKKPLLFEPGSKFSYSNSNYNVLAYIVEKISGIPYGEFLKKNIFDVLGMNDTRHHGQPQAIISKAATGYAPLGWTELQRAPSLDWAIKTGNGSLYSTVEDLARFERSFFSERILNEESKKKMFTPNLSNVAYGWYIRSHAEHERSYMTGRSPGFTSYLARYPKDEVCVIVLSNLYVSSAREIGEGVAAILFKAPHLTRTLSPELLTQPQQFVGSYQFGADFFRPNFKFEVKENKERLSCSFGEIIHDKGDEFILRGFWSTIIFQRDDQGRIISLTFDGVKATKGD